MRFYMVLRMRVATIKNNQLLFKELLENMAQFIQN